VSYPGKFIVVEGCEGTGKSTLCMAIADLISQTSSLEVTLTLEPGGTDFGQEVRRLLKSTEYDLSAKSELLLFLADRAHHCEDVIVPALTLGRYVVSDRYKYSTYAYQCYAGEAPLDLAVAMTDYATCGLEPDLLILLDGPPEELFQSRGRDTSDRIEMKSLDYHRRVRDGFLDLFGKHDSKKIMVDALLPIEEVRAQAWRAVACLIHES